MEELIADSLSNLLVCSVYVLLHSLFGVGGRGEGREEKDLFFFF